jgi:eukaryotic-like serine/threonine-protein kinase
MVCGNCGTVAPAKAARCATCDSDLLAAPGSAVTTDGDSLTSLETDSDPRKAQRHTRPDSLQPGQKFGTRYTVIKKLGAGGMGAVYHAWDESLGIAVALKVIRLDASTSPEETRQLEARFKRELLLARQVTHPNVVRIHDLGELGQTKYLTMAYVDGADLATVVRRDGKLAVARAIGIARQIAEGLSAAHAAGVVHRDLKPANVMLDGEDRALLTDFGIARSIDTNTLHTAPGSVVGTLEYMAPEQARGEPADRRSDVYSLGLILYEMLAGGRPRQVGGGLAELLSRVEKGPPPIETVAPETPLALQQIVARSLSKDPDHRYASGAEFLADLNRLEPDGAASPTVVPAPSAIAPASRRRSKVVPAVLVLMAVAAAGWWGFGRRAPETPARRHEPVSILIADFENRAADPVFDGALEQALAIGMEGAPFIANYPRQEATKLATTLRPGSRLDASAAQLVAVRQEIGVVLAGSVAQESGGYLLQVRALRPGNSEAFATADARASDKAGVLRAVDRLATELRMALGDTPAAGGSEAESFSAGSLDAVREYTIAQALSTDRRNEEAIAHYQAAVQHDPQFGRAYAGWAVSAFDLGRRAEADELWARALSLMDRMSEREKYRTLGGYYLGVARNYEKAIEAYRSLVEQYPADLAGHNNLAVAYFFTRDFPKAFEYGKRAIDVYPNSLKFRNNYALYAMYAGDFKTAAENAQQVLQRDPKYDAAYLPLAVAAVSAGDVARAREIYSTARGTGPSGASLAAIGLADLDLYEGRISEAVSTLEPAILIDRQTRNTFGEAAKTVALAEALTTSPGPAAGVKAINALLAGSSDESVSVPAARVLNAAKQAARALELVRRLDERTQPVPRAYARIIAGELALDNRRHTDAIDEFVAAIKSADLWLARFDLGVAYVGAGRYAEAISEFDICLKRRGEATSLFFDDIPTYRYTAVLPYWIGRAQQGLKMSGAASSFEQFVKLRSAATSDPLVLDARQRLTSLQSGQ